MANNRLVLEGLEQFKADLRNLPSELAGEGGGIVTSAAQSAVAEIVAGYPEGPPRKNKVSGGLKRGVKMTLETSAFGTIAVVRSTARHSHLWEFGTQVRNFQGANRGAMPEPVRPNFIPVMQRRRKAMYDALKGLLTRAGLVVSGDA